MLAKSEIFFPRFPMGLTDLEISRALNVPANGLPGEEKANLVRENPERVINYLKQASKNRQKVISFKIFEGHLDPETFRRLILEDETILKVFIDRDILPSYISLLKSSALQQSSDINTSDLLVEINPKSMSRWMDRNREWYQFCTKHIHRQRTLFLPYEEFAAAGDSANYAYVATKLRTAGIHIDGLSNAENVVYQKQDRSLSLRRSVRNWDDLVGVNEIQRLVTDQAMYFYDSQS